MKLFFYIAINTCCNVHVRNTLEYARKTYHLLSAQAFPLPLFTYNNSGKIIILMPKANIGFYPFGITAKIYFNMLHAVPSLLAKNKCFVVNR